MALSKKRTRGLFAPVAVYRPNGRYAPEKTVAAFSTELCQKSTKSDAFFHCRIILDVLRDGKLQILELLKASYRILSV
jgi:hypothetical protein